MFSETDTIIEVENIGKLYSRAPAATRRREAKIFGRALFKRPPAANFSLAKSEFWSLNNINFQLSRGEAVGIIGLNGAGKTTLLRILAGQILPDKGEVRIWGETAAMIDLQAGFKNGSTGRENIYLRGAMLGRTRKDIESTEQEIIDFAELGDAIDAPFGTYSSGMRMRLAFSIMIAAEPDILFIDEILSVGDFRFRQKCLAKLRDMRERVAFVLVSHSMNDIKMFCQSVIVLNKGEIAFEGPPDKAVDVYENLQFPEQKSQEEKQKAILNPQFNNADAIQVQSHGWCNKAGKPVDVVKHGEDLYYEASFTVSHDTKKLTIGVPVWTETGAYATGFSTQLSKTVFNAKAGEAVVFRLKVPTNPLNPGKYISNLAVTDGPEFLYRGTNSVLEVAATAQKRWGCFTTPHEWQRKEN